MKKNLTKEVILEEGIPGFDWSTCEDDKKRIKRNTQMTRKCETIVDCFRKVLGKAATEGLSKDMGQAPDNFILVPGKFLTLQVEEVTSRGLKLTSPYIKEQIINKDNLTQYPEFQVFLAKNNHEVVGVVREVSNSSVRIDVLDAYYRLWVNYIETENIKKEVPIQAENLQLTRGGFLGDVNISHLSQLTGVRHTATCFIPGSQIVRNIERDFEKWVGETVNVLPQKFTQFNTPFSHKDNCLVCSRKQILLYEEAKNIEDLYKNKIMQDKLNKMIGTDSRYVSDIFTGTITGVINSNKKKGVFVELHDKYITGMLPCDTYALGNYIEGNDIQVRIKDFEVMPDQNLFVKNRNGNIKWANVRVTFEEA